MAPAALVQLAAALAQMRPASDLVLAQMIPAMRMMIALSPSWTRSPRTRTPIRTQSRIRVSGRGVLVRINPKPRPVNHHGDPETTGLREVRSITRGGLQILAAETRSGPSLTHSHSLCGTRTLSATLQLRVEEMDDLTLVLTAQSVLRTHPTSADTCYATQGSDCIPASFVTRASSLPLSSLFTLAHIQGNGLSAALSVGNVSPEAGT